MKTAKAQKTKKRHPVRSGILLGLLLAAAAALCVYSHFGGFGTGDCADTDEFSEYATGVEDIAFPDGAQIIALGEATHGNADFQQLKLTVFQQAVSEKGVRAFGLEADAGCCEAVNRYIHGGEGTAEEAAAALSFEIYRTPETAQLISWMREYNQTAVSGGDLRFYGFDMQRIEYNYEYLLEAAEACGLDTAALKKLWDGDGYSDSFTADERAAVIDGVRDELTAQGEAVGAHFADILLQNNELGKVAADAAVYPALRDKLMAQNALWILGQEKALGCEAIFLAGHNGHMKQFGNYSAEDKVMGNILSDELGGGYFVIGTDFFRSSCNLPTGKDRKRVGHTFYSYDPLAKAAKKCGYDQCWLDFSAVPEDSALHGDISNYCRMGTLGDVPYDPLIMGLLPQSYRVWQSPAELYDGMIFVTDAQPTVIASLD